MITVVEPGRIHPPEGVDLDIVIKLRYPNDKEKSTWL